MCATTTPKRTANRLEQFDPFNERIKNRNAIAQEFARRNHIQIDDLFTLVERHPEFYREDGTHFKDGGVQTESVQVAASIKSALKTAVK